jgi:nucleotide-binding universal stress UspA family protein
MFRRIVIPLDGSELAACAVPAAATLAKRTDAAIALVRVVDPPDGIREMVSTADRERREHARADLVAVAARLRDDQIPTTIAIRQGNPVDNIVTLAGDVEGDLICMATHGRSGLRRVIVGSVAERVLHDALVPVMLIPPGVTLRSGMVDAVITVPLDGSERAEMAIPCAVSVARIFGARLELVRVWNVSTPAFAVALYAADENHALFDAMLDVTEASVTSYLESVRARLRPDGIAVRVTALRGDPAEQLCTYVSMTRPVMVVMGTHGRSGVARWVLGSVAAAIVRNGIAPVLLIRPVVASIRRDVARMEASAGLRSSDADSERSRRGGYHA